MRIGGRENNSHYYGDVNTVKWRITYGSYACMLGVIR